MEKLRILVFGDHPVMRKGVVNALSSLDTLQVVGEAGNLAEAIRKASALEPEIVLIDLHLQDANAYEAGIIFREMLPNVKVLLYGDVSDKEDAGVGVEGYPMESAPQVADRLKEASVSPGAELRARRRPKRRRLTRTEQRIAGLVVKGYKNKAIASSLFISINTVKSHIQSIFRKVDAENRAELVKILLADPTLMGLEQPHLDLSGRL